MRNVSDVRLASTNNILVTLVRLLSAQSIAQAQRFVPAIAIQLKTHPRINLKMKY